MATKEFLHNIDLVTLGQLLNARLHNVTSAERTTLAASLGVANEGLFVYDTTEKMQYIWDGTQFQPQSVQMEGDVIFRGVLLAAVFDEDPDFTESGSLYKIGEAGTLTFPGVTTYIPSAVVEPGDELLFTAPDTVYVVQRNDEQATEANLGNVRLASQAQVNAGEDGEAVVTPLTLQGKLEGHFYVRQYTTTVDLTALTNATITHNLDLVDRDAMTVSAFHGNREISLQVDSVNANSLTVRSLVGRTGVRITVKGAVAV